MCCIEIEQLCLDYIILVKNLDHNLTKYQCLQVKLHKEKYPNVFISNKKYSPNDVAYALNELERFPLAVVVPEKNALDTLTVCV